MSEHRTIIEGADGTLLGFDALLNDGIEDRGDLTSHPVEEGGEISDHFRARPTTYRLQGMVSLTPTEDKPWRAITATNVDVQVEVPQPTLLDKLVPIGGLLPAKRQTLHLLAQAYEGADFLRETYDQLLAWFASATLLSVYTRDRDLSSMIIIAVSHPRAAQDGASATFGVDMQQVRIVSASETAAPAVSEPRGQGAKGVGVQGKTPGASGADGWFRESTAHSLMRAALGS